jgi:hypothetical protein
MTDELYTNAAAHKTNLMVLDDAIATMLYPTPDVVELKDMGTVFSGLAEIFTGLVVVDGEVDGGDPTPGSASAVLAEVHDTLRTYYDYFRARLVTLRGDVQTTFDAL